MLTALMVNSKIQSKELRNNADVLEDQLEESVQVKMETADVKVVQSGMVLEISIPLRSQLLLPWVATIRCSVIQSEVRESNVFAQLEVSKTRLFLV